MKKESFFDMILDSVSTAFFIVYGLPLLIMILLLLLGYQFVYGNYIRYKYKDEKNIIFISKLEDTLYNYANKVYDKEAFVKVQLDEDADALEIDYYLKDPNKSLEEYNYLVKNEVTKLYNSLKNKTIISDSFLVEGNRISINMVFNYPVGDEYHGLCRPVLKYTKETGFDEEIYQKIIDSTIVTQEKLNIVLSY